MKRNALLMAVAVAFMFTISSCTSRLIDFTIISTKNMQMSIDKTKGKEVKIKMLKAFGIGAHLKDAIDKAIAAGGPGCDMLVDGVIRYSNYYFVAGYRIEGVAMNSLKLKAELGEDKFDEFMRAHNVVTPENTSNVPVITE